MLEKYLVPGGSAAHYKREGYTFDVGSSMMFGFGDQVGCSCIHHVVNDPLSLPRSHSCGAADPPPPQGTTNLITKALEAVGKKMATLPDPTQVHYHLPASKAHPQVIKSPTLVAVAVTPRGQPPSALTCHLYPQTHSPAPAALRAAARAGPLALLRAQGRS